MGEPADLSERLTRNEARRLDRLSQLAVVAAREAAAQARLEGIAGERVGLVAGTGLGCVETTWRQLAGIAARGLGHAEPLGFADSMDNAPAAHAAIALGCRGPSLTLTEREISGEIALITGALLLSARAVDAVVVVAGDASSEEQRSAVLRFAPGLSPAEGAGAVVLESDESASRRGAQVLGRLLGHAQARTPLPFSPLRQAPAPLLDAAASRALSLAGLSAEQVLSLPPESLRGRLGWLMADGVLRVVAGLLLLERDQRGAALVLGRARGGAAAALVLGR